jgi:hypothetical protein
MQIDGKGQNSCIHDFIKTQDEEGDDDRCL